MRFKQVIVVNGALGLPRGKLAAQVAHAAVAGFLSAGDEARRGWLGNGMPKIVLECASETDLLALVDAARDRSIPAYLVRDAGRTVVEAGTATCLGLGPAPDDDIDGLTGGLALLR